MNVLPPGWAKAETTGSICLKPVKDIRVGARLRRELGDLAGLVQSISAVGLLHPIIVDESGELIAGLRRLQACRELRWDLIPVRVVQLEDPLRAQADENLVRKDFTPSEWVAVAEAIEARERHAAKARQGTRTDLGSELPAESAESRQRVAAATGMSHFTLGRARAVVEAARRDPERYAPLQERMDRTGKVNGVYRMLVVGEKAAAIERDAPHMPAGKFNVIVADPPWQYPERDPSQRGRTPYPTLSNEEIAALSMLEHAAEDCVLWLWATNAHLPAAFEILREWGFTYKTTLTWAKNRMGTGDWLRGQTEHCLLGIRGNPVVRLKNQPGRAVRWKDQVERLVLLAPPPSSQSRPSQGRAGADFAEAVRQWNADHGRDWGSPGTGECPACGHRDCFGRLPEIPEKWCCFSSNHQADSGGCGHQTADGHWIGDALDLEAHRRNVSRYQRSHAARGGDPGAHDQAERGDLGRTRVRPGNWAVPGSQHPFS